MTAPQTAQAASVAASYAALDAAYRAATARTAIAVAQGLLFRWTSVSSTDLAGTGRTWLDDGVGLVLAGQRNVVELANLYTLQVRELSVPNAPVFTPPPPRPPNEEQIRRSLEFLAFKQTGQEIGRLEAVRDSSYAEPDYREEGEPSNRESEDRTFEARREQLMRDAIQRAAGGAVRLVTSAGHRQIEDSVRSDAVAIGWVRTTKPGCCCFCAILASRGYVYKEESFDESNKRFEGIGGQKVHDNCVPAGTLVAGPVVEVGFRRRYEGEAIYFRTASGNELTITPNHPVLTDEGWVPANLLKRGSNVLSRPGGEWASPGVPDDYQKPVPIEDRLASLLVEGGAFRMPPSAEQFHGDWSNSEVDVIAADRLFADRFEAELTELAVELALPGGGAARPAVAFARFCPEKHFSLAGDPSAGGLVGSGHLGGALFGSKAVAPDSGRLPSIPRSDSNIPQGARYNAAINPEIDRDAFDRLTCQMALGDHLLVNEDSLSTSTRFDPPSAEFGEDSRVAYADLGARLLRRLAGEVVLDSVVELRRVSLSASHVYNLQTAEGWYSANGIIVSNCGCGLRPIYSPVDPLPDRTEALEQMWIDMTRETGFGGKRAINEFRRRYDQSELARPMS